MKHGFHDLMADVLAENTHLTFQLLTKDFFEFVDASVTVAELTWTIMHTLYEQNL